MRFITGKGTRPGIDGRGVACSVGLAAFVLGLLAGCTPSREFLLKRSTELGEDKNYVRVLLIDTKERISISSSSRIKISDLSDRRVLRDMNKGSVYFYPERLKRPVAVESWNAPLSVNGTAYRGSIELHSRMGRLLVINVVTMDEYLSGVVPARYPAAGIRKRCAPRRWRPVVTRIIIS
ncbi:MAG TPA: SpoIID/LytB domain-containing protein [Spirochaetota bacterium]|nr:SpoIID/LytB domain-containing protein [Spirochaetota bacterium]